MRDHTAQMSAPFYLYLTFDKKCDKYNRGRFESFFLSDPKSSYNQDT